MKVSVIGADISKNDVSCSQSLVDNIENDLYRITDLGASHVGLTNVTGDDVAISAVYEDDLIEKINLEIVNILRDNAEDLGDLNGISDTKEGAGEGISYAEANFRDEYYPDAIILAFDTYGGEPFVKDVANSSLKAASGMEGLTDFSTPLKDSTKHIPGVGYVSSETDDPVIVTTVEDLNSVGVIASAMIGAALGNKNTYLVKRHTACNVLPGSVIFSATAFMNGNIMDLSIPFENKTRILK
ncbi:hypothetical protein [Methanobrevibacter sp. DSM 116169]|uniref:hypothetical protein n=1 Tax=Methanobrevibacter sp. DSM 116169 TaxID=3242727 RepID=UPI0038FC1B45